MATRASAMSDSMGGSLAPKGMDKVTYKQTKDYLMSLGLTRKELNAATKFQLREIAESKGVDLGPLLEKREEARQRVVSIEEEAAKAHQQNEEAAAALEVAAAAQAEAQQLAEAKAVEAAAATEKLQMLQKSVSDLDAQAQKAAEEAAEAEAEAARVAAAAAAAKAEEEALAKAAAEEAAKAKAAAEKEAAEKEAKAKEELKQAEINLERERAAARIQANARRRLQEQIYYKAWFAVVTIQKLHRGRVIKAIVAKLLTAAQLLKAGNIFLKFSKDGPPHDRLVWLSDNLREILWCNPNKNKVHNLKPDAKLGVSEISAVVDGIKTDVFKQAMKGREFSQGSSDELISAQLHGKATMSLSNSLKQKSALLFRQGEEASQVVKKGASISDLQCLSVISSNRTVDLVAPSNRVRDDWLWALRMVLVHLNTVGSLKELAAQRKLVGGKMTQSGLLSAHDVLTDAYEVHEITVQRTKMGMGVVMDSASNVIVELEDGSTGMAAGLKEGDAVMMVDKVVVTAIESGMVVPRSPITAVIDPMKTELTFTVFRPKDIDLS